MKLRQECHASQGAIKSYLVRQTHYRSVIRVSFFRFLPFLRRAIWTDMAPGRGWSLTTSRRPDLTRLSWPFFFDAPPGTNGRCLWPDLQFPVNKSRCWEIYTRAESNRTMPRRIALYRFDVTTTKRRVIAGARAGDERFSRSGGEFVSNVITYVVVYLSVRSTDFSSFLSRWRRRRDAELIFRSRVREFCPTANWKRSAWLPIIHRIQKTTSEYIYAFLKSQREQFFHGLLEKQSLMSQSR